MSKKNKRITTTIILLITAVAIISITSAKYIYNSVWNYYLKSRGFYFESDLLEINTKKNSLLNWDGNNISFILKNSENNELISEYDISYKLTCEVIGDETDYIGCDLNNTQKSTYNGTLSSVAGCVNTVDTTDVSNFLKAECELGGYTWNEEITTKQNTFNLFLKDETKSIDEVTVKITAESTSPYKKSLIGIFNLNKVDEEESEYITEFQNFNEYSELSVINKTNSDKCFLISFDSNNYVIELSSDTIVGSYVDSNDKVNKIETKIPKVSSSTYKFYKHEDLVSSIDDFIIEEKEC